MEIKKIEIDSHLSWLKDQKLFANTNCKLRCDSHIRCLLQCLTLHSNQPLRLLFVCNQCKLPPCRLWGIWKEVSWYLFYAWPRPQYGNRCCNFVSKVSLRKNHITYRFTEICVIEISSVAVWVVVWESPFYAMGFDFLCSHHHQILASDDQSTSTQ